MLDIVRRIWLDYPIPFSVSIWGGTYHSEENSLAPTTCPMKNPYDNSPDNFSVPELLEQCLLDLRSDIALVKQTMAQGLNTVLSKDARSVISVKLDPRFQGNRYVKWSYDSVNRVVSVRYFPATIKYSVNVTPSNVNQLEGDSLIYLLAYLHWKMADKEYTILSAVQLNADNGEVDLSALKDYADRNHQLYIDMKPEILTYSASS